MELDNKIVGRNLAKFRKLKDIKAADLAERIGMKESAYTKYERGESAITVDLVQKVATALDINPISILAAAPDNFIESITSPSSQGTGIGNTIQVEGDITNVDKVQSEAMIKLMEKLIMLLTDKK